MIRTCEFVHESHYNISCLEFLNNGIDMSPPKPEEFFINNGMLRYFLFYHYYIISVNYLLIQFFLLMGDIF